MLRPAVATVVAHRKAPRRPQNARMNPTPPPQSTGPQPALGPSDVESTLRRRSCRRRTVAALGAAWLVLGAAQAQRPAPADARIATARFQEVALRPTREVAAVVVPRNESRIGAELAGTVRRWGADSGATVRRGDLLVELDAVDHRLARDRARAALDAAQARNTLAEAQLRRARELVAKNFLSQEALAGREAEAQLAEAELASQRLALAGAERALAKTRILAPFDASVRQRLAQVGETVVPGTPLYVLVQMQGAEVSGQLAPEDADSLRQATDARFVRADGTTTPLRLLRVAAALNSPARTVDVRLAGDALVPGRDGRLVWSDPRPHLPAALLVRRDDRLGVFSVSAGRARFIALPTAQEGRATPAGLAPQTVIVTQGQQSLRDGDQVGR